MFYHSISDYLFIKLAELGLINYAHNCKMIDIIRDQNSIRLL